MSFENWMHGEIPKPGNPPYTKPIGEADWWQAGEEPRVYVQGSRETNAPAWISYAAQYCSLDITVSWDAAAGADGYVVEVQIDDMTTWQRVAAVGASVLSIVDTRESGHTYQYRVAAVFGATLSAWTVGSEIYLLCQRW